MATPQKIDTKAPQSKAEELGQHIKRFRVARNLDLSDVADRCGVKVSTARDWESGDAIPASREWVRLKKMVARGLTTYGDLWRDALADRDTPAIADRFVEIAKEVEPQEPLQLEATALMVAPMAPRPEDASSLGEAVRRARLIEGLSQAELGEMLGVEQSTVSGWELGRITPIRTHLNRLAELIPSIAKWRDETRDISKPIGPLGMTFKHVAGDPRAAAQMVIEASDTERGLPRIPEIRHDAYHTDPNAQPMERFEEEPETPITLEEMDPHERLKELGIRHVESMLERARARKDVEDCNAALIAARSDLEAADRELATILADMTRTIEEITKG